MESEGDRDGDRRAVDDPDREALEPVPDDRQGPPQGEKPNAWTRSAPAARTRSPAPRLDHRMNRSNVRRTRSDAGTGSTPHSGGLRSRTIRRRNAVGL